jgi:hypothetical protein
VAGVIREKMTIAAQTLKGRIEVPIPDLELLADSMRSQQGYASFQEVTRQEIARWFEVPLEEFDQTPRSQLEPEVLFNHLYYETVLQKWFEDWGYNVEVGQERQGDEGTDFTPDLVAELSTLHGRFQIFTCLICDNPPSHYRVLASFETLEAYTRRDKEFGERDILLLVTPHKFLGNTDNSIRVQAQEENYFVVTLEGEELQDLHRARDPKTRHDRMQHFVIESIAGARPF